MANDLILFVRLPSAIYSVAIVEVDPKTNRVRIVTHFDQAGIRVADDRMAFIIIVVLINGN